MRNRWILRLKPCIALLLSVAIVVSFGGCGSRPNTAQSENETEFQAYFEPLTSDDVATEGDVYYACSQILLTSVGGATYKDIEKLIKNNRGEIIGYISVTGDYQIRFNDAKTFTELERLVENLKKDALVEDASLAYVARFSSETVDDTKDPWMDINEPSDISGSVWEEENPDGNNWWAEAIHMPTVWRMNLATQTVKVGIIDSMFDITNKDLDENVFVKTWNNPEKDDGSCKVAQLYNDAVAAYDQAVLSKDSPKMNAAKKKIEDTCHGTHVAGIIAAQANNGFGIAGVNQNVELYGYAYLSEEAAASKDAEWQSVFQFKCALAHLLNENVKVINISMGFDSVLTGTQDGDPFYSTFTSVNSKALESFLLKYIEAGKEFLIVKSAGNDSNKKEHNYSVYEAKNDLFGAITNERVAQRIIIVGAASYNAKYGYYPIAKFSNRGDRVDVYAPGVKVLSDIPANAATLLDGTSMATPIVTGLASLIWGINPSLSAEQVRSIIIASSGATILNLDNKSLILRDLINWAADPTAIVNANICVQLAQATIGNGNTSDTEYGTVSGMVYAVTSEGGDVLDINVESLVLYNEDDDVALTIPLQSYAYAVEDDNTGEATILNLHAYSALIEPGTYTLEASADRFETQTKQLTIKPNDVVNVDFEFLLADASMDPSQENLPENFPAEIYVSDAFSAYENNDRGSVNNYHIPKVNIAGEAAEKTNAAIYKDLYHGVYEEIDVFDGICGNSGITYIWAESNGVISIIVEWMPEDLTGHGPTYTKAYNISAETGALLTKKEIIAAYGFTLEEFYDLAKEKILHKYEEWNQELVEYEEFKSDYEKYLNKAISKESLENMRVFVSDSGDLIVYADFTYLLTYDRITAVINMTGESQPKYPEFSWDMPEEPNEKESENREPGNTPENSGAVLGTWYSADEKKVYVFASTGSDLAAVGSQIESVCGDYVEIRLESHRVDYGGYDLGEASIILYRPEADEYAMSIDGDTMILNDEMYRKVSAEVKNQILGKWVNGNTTLDFEKEDCVCYINGEYSGQDVYYVISEDLIVINAQAFRYALDGTTLKFQGTVYQKEGADNSVPVLENLREQILGTWVDDMDFEYMFFEDGTYKMNALSYVSDGTLWLRETWETGTYEICDKQTIKIYSSGHYSCMDGVYDSATDTLTVGGSWVFQRSVYQKAEIEAT